MIKVAAFSRWMTFAAALCLQIAAARDRIFDLKIRDGKTFEEKEFAGLLPTAVFDIRADFTLDAVEKARKEAPEGTARGKLDRSRNHIIEELPGDDMIGRVDYIYAAGSTVLREVSSSTQLVVPSRGRLERFYGALVRLLGPPQRLDRGLLYGKPNRETLNFTWAQEGNRLLLLLKNDEAYFDVTLSYYPGESNATYARVLANSQEEVSNDPAAALKAYLDQVAKLPAGNGPPAPVAAAADEKECFRQYNEAYMVRFGRKWRIIDKPQIAVLNEALSRRYQALGNKKTCEHLLGIIQGSEPGLKAYKARIGAEAYLASLQVPEVIPCLFEVLRPQSGLLSGPAVEGLATRCQGDVLDQVMRMLEAGGNSADQAAAILSFMRDPALRKGAERKVPALKSADAKKRAQWAIGYAEGLPAIE